jgi:Spy/CpxP family protein refolding chaperone
MKRTLIALSLVASIGLAASALAGPHGHGHGRGLEHKIGKLDLDPATEQAVFKVLDDARPAAREQHRELRAAREAMRALLEKDTPDQAAVMAQADTIGTLRVAADKQRLETLLAVQKLLTPEQRAQLREKGKRGRHGGCDRR